MRVLSDEISVEDVREVTIIFEGNVGYTRIKEFGEMLVSCGEDFGYDEIETVLVEMPENDYHKFDGENQTAIYEVINNDSPLVGVSQEYKALIRRVE